MRRIGLALLAVLSCLLLTACGAPQAAQLAEENKAAQQSLGAQLDTALPEGAGMTTRTVEKEHRAEDGTLLARGSYDVPVLDTGAAEGNTLKEDPAQTVARCFNRYFEEWLDKRVAYFQEIGEMADDVYAQSQGTEHCPWNDAGYCYADEMTPVFWDNGRIACVTLQYYSFTGGPHAYATREAVTFDLFTGQRLTIADLTGDWSGLQKAVGGEILSQVAELVSQYGDGRFFEDYEKIVEDWIERSVFFDEDGITVVFSVYDIAPYAAGEQAFEISYDRLAPYLNDYGRTLLGIHT